MALECLKRHFADMMLDTFCIPLCCFIINPKSPQKRHHNPVTPRAGFGQCLPHFSKEYGAIWLSAYQTCGLEPRDILGDGRWLDAKASSDVNRPRFPLSVNEFGDQFDIIFRHLGLMGLTHGCKTLCLRFRGSVCGLKGVTAMCLRLCHNPTLKRKGTIDNLFALGRYISHG